MKRILIPLIFVFAVMFISEVSATTVQITPSADITGASQDAQGNYYVTEGGSFTVTVDVTNNDASTDASGVEATLSLPSGLSTTDSLSKSIGTISAGSTESQSWSVSGDVAGNYLGGISISVSGSNTNSDSDTTGILVKSSPSIVGGISCAATDSKVLKSSFTVTVTVQNLGDMEATGISVVLNSSPSLTISNNPKSITSISGGSSDSVSYSLNSSEETTYTFTATVTSSNAGNDVATCNAQTRSSLPNGYVCSLNSNCATGCCYSSLCAAVSACVSDDGNGGGGGGGGATTPSNNTFTKLWSKVTPGNVTIMKLNKKEIGIHEIQINVINQANNVRITVTKLDDMPASVTHEVTRIIYQYLQIDTTNLDNDNIDNATIRFKVEKTWINQNQINKSTIALNRYTNAWNKLVTTITDEDNDYVHYEAETPGFSVYAITGGKISLTEEGQPGACTPSERRCLGNDVQECNTQGDAWSTIETCQYGCSNGVCQESLPVDITLIMVAIIIIIAIAGAAMYFLKFKKKPSPIKSALKSTNS